MSTQRKKYAHPPLVPPRTVIKDVPSKEAFGGFERREVYEENDNGKIVRDRAYIYHPTKGWRSRSIRGGGFNLTRWLIEVGRKR